MSKYADGGIGPCNLLATSPYTLPLILCNALYVHVYCRGRAVTNVEKTCGPTPCFILVINTFKLNTLQNEVRVNLILADKLNKYDMTQNCHVLKMRWVPSKHIKKCQYRQVSEAPSSG